MQETTQRAMWLQWKVLATGLAAAAVLAAIVFYETPQAITSHPSHVTEVVLKRAPQEIPVVETRSTNVVQPKIRIRKVSKEPEVLIDPREAAAFRTFVDDVQQQRIDPARLRDLFDIAGMEPIEIPPLVPAAPEKEGGSL
jgi:hypothetical protein